MLVFFQEHCARRKKKKTPENKTEEMTAFYSKLCKNRIFLFHFIELEMKKEI